MHYLAPFNSIDLFIFKERSCFFFTDPHVILGKDSNWEDSDSKDESELSDSESDVDFVTA